MANGRQFRPTAGQVMDDLAPYRRLIETQRQLVELAKKHEQTRRENEALRELLAREIVKSPSRLQLFRHRLQTALTRARTRLPRFGAADNSFQAIDNKQPLSC